MTALLEVRDSAVEQRPGRDAVGGQDARGYRGACAALADRDDRAAVRQLAGELADKAVRNVAALRDIALVALVLPADIDDLDRVVREESLELVDADRLEPIGAGRTEQVAREVEQAHGSQARRGRLGVLLRGGADCDRGVGIEQEARLRPERRAGDRDVERTRQMSCGELVRRTDVKHLAVDALELLERLRRAEEGPAVERDHSLDGRRLWRRAGRVRGDELRLVAEGESAVRGEFLRDR